MGPPAGTPATNVAADTPAFTMGVKAAEREPGQAGRFLLINLLAQPYC
jgi:hypothetical protein